MSPFVDFFWCLPPPSGLASTHTESKPSPLCTPAHVHKVLLCKTRCGRQPPTSFLALTCPLVPPPPPSALPLCTAHSKGMTKGPSPAPQRLWHPSPPKKRMGRLSLSQRLPRSHPPQGGCLFAAFPKRSVNERQEELSNPQRRDNPPFSRSLRPPFLET